MKTVFPTERQSDTFIYDTKQTTQIQRFDNPKYPILTRLKNEQMDRMWTHKAFPFGRDTLDYTTLDDASKHAFKSNLQRQVMLDSIQGRSPIMVFSPFNSNPEWEALLSLINMVETNVHSESYTEQIRAIFENPQEIFDEIMDIREIVGTASDISKYYDNLMHTPIENTHEHKKAFWFALHAWNALEGIRFYVSFVTNWSIYHNGKKMFASTQINKKIAQDEELHREATVVLKKYLINDDPEFADIDIKYREELENIYLAVANDEIQWIDYLFKHGELLGLTKKSLTEYIKWLTASRMRDMGFEYKGPVFDKSPMPWTESYLNSNYTQSPPQEGTLSEYNKDAIFQDDGALTDSLEI